MSATSTDTSKTQAEARVADWPGITPAQAKRVAALLRYGVGGRNARQ